MSLCRCYGNQLPTVFETQIINLLPVYIGSQNTSPEWNVCLWVVLSSYLPRNLPLRTSVSVAWAVKAEDDTSWPCIAFIGGCHQGLSIRETGLSV